MTDDGSLPSAPRMISAPLRSAHVCNCSPAAARKVSPAAIITVRPSATCCAEILPRLVVLPAPFTPTMSQMFGPSIDASKFSSRLVPTRREAMSFCNAVINSAGVEISFAFTRARNGSSKACATLTPTSARNNASSKSSQLESLISPRPSTELTAPASTFLNERFFSATTSTTGSTTGSAITRGGATGFSVAITGVGFLRRL